MTAHIFPAIHTVEEAQQIEHYIPPIAPEEALKIYAFVVVIESKTVTTFRTGAWVERIKEYSEKVSKEAREEELKPFSGIDF